MKALSKFIRSSYWPPDSHTVIKISTKTRWLWLYKENYSFVLFTAAFKEYCKKHWKCLLKLRTSTLNLGNWILLKKIENIFFCLLGGSYRNITEYFTYSTKLTTTFQEDLVTNEDFVNQQIVPMIRIVYAINIIVDTTNNFFTY